MEQHDFEVVTVPILDTGIGREAGYEDDAALIAAAQAQRDALPPYIDRAMLAEVDARIDRAFLEGTP